MALFLSDRGFASARGLSYTVEDTAANLDAALPLTHNLGALPSALELWVEQTAGQWEKHDAATYILATSTQLITSGTTLTSVFGGSVNVRLVASTGAVAISVAEASASQAGIVSTGTQTFAGAKTFSDQMTLGASTDTPRTSHHVIYKNLGSGTPSTATAGNGAWFAGANAYGFVAGRMPTRLTGLSGVLMEFQTSTVDTDAVWNIRVNTVAHGATTNPDVAMTVLGNSNVGIGTPSPAGLLHLNTDPTGDCNVIFECAGGSDVNLKFAETDPANEIFAIQYTGSAGSNPNNLFKIRANSDGAAGVDLDVLTITQAGNVGIGTSSLTNTRFTITENTYSALRMENNDTGGGYWNIGQSDNAYSVGGGVLYFVPDSETSSNATVKFHNSGAVTLGPSGANAISHQISGGGIANGLKFSGAVTASTSYDFLETALTDFTAIVTFNAFVSSGRNRTHTYLVTVRGGNIGTGATLLDTGSGATVTITFAWNNTTKRLSFSSNTNCANAKVAGLIIA